MVSRMKRRHESVNLCEHFRFDYMDGAQAPSIYTTNESASPLSGIQCVHDGYITSKYFTQRRLSRRHTGMKNAYYVSDVR